MENTRHILQAFRDAGAPPPTFREVGEGLMVTAYAAAGTTPQKTPQNLAQKMSPTAATADAVLHTIRANPSATRQTLGTDAAHEPEHRQMAPQTPQSRRPHPAHRQRPQRKLGSGGEAGEEGEVRGPMTGRRNPKSKIPTR